MRFACWINKAILAKTSAKSRTHTHKYLILIAFPQQQWLRERASVLRYTYIVCIVNLFEYKQLFCFLSKIRVFFTAAAINVFVDCCVTPCSLIGLYWCSWGPSSSKLFVWRTEWRPREDIAKGLPYCYQYVGWPQLRTCWYRGFRYISNAHFQSLLINSVSKH